MNIVIFAGGAGTRLWPLSRRNSPKQFEQLKGDQSTLQMAVERVRPFGLEHVYISTNDRYEDLVREQVPDVPEDHILTEPAKRDLAAAVALTLLRLKRDGVSGTVAILWADHFMEHPENFRAALARGAELITEDPNRFVFLGEKARFPNHNLGWIQTGDAVGPDVHAFASWRYRPDVVECQEMFASHDWVWNPGYFVFDIDFVLGLYEQHMPEMYTALSKMVADESTMAEQYKQLESLSFDQAIIEKISPEQAVVLRVNLGWSDPGTLYALKEALTDSEEENFEKGRVVAHETRDCFLYNEDENKLLATVGLDGVVVVNTKDGLLVCDKDRVPDIKALLKRLEDDGLESYL